jgi:hypothetical protein
VDLLDELGVLERAEVEFGFCCLRHLGHPRSGLLNGC